MTSIAEMGGSTLVTLVTAWRLNERGVEIFIPRTSLAIFNGLKIQFPEEIKKRGEERALEAIGCLSPVLIALNEMADIGISVHLVNGTESGSLVVDKMQKYLRGWTEEFLQKFPGHKDTLAKLVNDFCLLSLFRNNIDMKQIPTWLELDSAIFESACHKVATSESWKDNSFSKPQTFEDLKEEYKEYLIWGKPEKTNSKLRGLHAMEMVLKVTDDRTGKEDDKELGLPSFCKYADSVCAGDSRRIEGVFKEITERYRQVAVDGGISRMSTFAVEKLFHLSSIAKAKLAAGNNEKVKGPYIEKLPEQGQITTVLRHTLLGRTNFAEILR